MAKRKCLYKARNATLRRSVWHNISVLVEDTRRHRVLHNMRASIIVAASSISTCTSFVPPTQSRPSTSLNGLFDGVKEAFGADGMGSLDGDRETPIDRWMGWNAKSSDEPQQAVGSKGATLRLSLRLRLNLCRTSCAYFSRLFSSYGSTR